ncbi:MAG: hypothetical protein AAFW64_00515 [Pseudomonadota bacterium]
MRSQFWSVAIGLLASITLATIVNAQQIVGTTTVGGQPVDLYSDGTWKLREAPTDADCKRVDARIQFSGSGGIWQSIPPPNTVIAAAFRHDDRHYGQYVSEALGRNQGLSSDTLSNLVVDGIAMATGQPLGSINVLSKEQFDVDGRTAELVVYSLRINGLPAVFANALLLEDDFNVQVMTYGIATEYTDRHKELMADFVAKTRID